MTWSRFGAFLLAAETLLIVPGPSVLFVISRGVASGRRAALGAGGGAVLVGLGVSLALSLPPD